MGVGSALITPATMAILMWTFTGPARVWAPIVVGLVLLAVLLAVFVLVELRLEAPSFDP
ncbi:hypothetical protein ACWC0C_30620 [Streptomyces sp. NPDC001709]